MGDDDLVEGAVLWSYMKPNKTGGFGSGLAFCKVV